jgi:hypothetical protein
MATTALPYSAQHYNSLLNIEDASNNFTPADIALLTTAIGQVFIKHNVQRLFGITLLHSHFSLDENEILLNTESSAVPWETPGRVEELLNVKCNAWRFVEQGIAPYEFTSDISPRPKVSDFQPFLSELKALLESLGLIKKLGIYVFTSDDLDSNAQVESMPGHVDNTLPLDIAPDNRPNRSIEVVWQFYLFSELGTKRRK